VIAKQSELGRKMFEVVEYLKKCGVERPQTLEQIDAALGLRSQENAALIEELRKNERIKFFQGAYSYKVHSLLFDENAMRATAAGLNSCVFSSFMSAKA